MNKQGELDSLDKRIKYYYRNNFSIKEISNKTGLKYNTVIYRIHKMKKRGILKKWWEEDVEEI